MDWKKLAEKLLFPPTAVLAVLMLLSAVGLPFTMIWYGAESILSISCYVVAFYTLVAVCASIPKLIRKFKTFKEENRYMRIWQDDLKLRINVTLFGTLLYNATYAVFHFVLGVVHASYWYGTLGCYYICLAVMRFYLARYTMTHKAGEHLQEEWGKYRTCGIAFLVMNFAVSLMIFFMVYWNRTMQHHEITTIALAAYTFSSMARAIVNVVKFRQYQSPVYSATKAVSLAAACVSMLTLESTMLDTFGGDMSMQDRKLMLALSGAAISFAIIAMAIYMIVVSTRQIKELEKEEE
ncbi:MAG: hypothetical protein J6L88_09620 [Clostridia bacterium]|nr:hypothetical protein [Clostridia bacterium]